MVVTRALKEERMQSSYLMSMQVSVWKNEKVLEMDNDDGCPKM